MKKLSICLLLLLTCILTFPSYRVQAKKGLDKPTHLTIRLKRKASGDYSHFELSWKNPSSIMSYGKKNPGLVVEVDVKNNGDPWHSESGKGLVVKPFDGGQESKLILDENSFASISEFNVFQSNYSFRIRYRNQDQTSPFSSYVKVGLRPVLKNVSPWAQPLLSKANRSGLIPASVKEDLKAPITREEFAHALILAYEKSQGKVAPMAKEAFKDADQTYILKAKNLGFIEGVGNNRFNPKGKITREQMALMTERLYKALNLQGQQSPKSFTDHNQIADWARPAVYNMASLNIIKGYQGQFKPKDTSSREEALSVIYRILELK